MSARFLSGPCENLAESGRLVFSLLGRAAESRRTCGAGRKRRSGKGRRCSRRNDNTLAPSASDSRAKAFTFRMYCSRYLGYGPVWFLNESAGRSFFFFLPKTLILFSNKIARWECFHVQINIISCEQTDLLQA